MELECKDCGNDDAQRMCLMKQYKVTLQDCAFGAKPYTSYIQVSSDAELAEYKVGWGMADVQILSIEELQPGDKGWKNDN